MRTDSTKYSGVFLEQLDKFVTDMFGDKSYLGNLALMKQTDTTNPHEAIRVTDLALIELPSDSKEASMYKLIWRNTVESCMSEAKFMSHLIKITAPKMDDSNSIYFILLRLFLFLFASLILICDIISKEYLFDNLDNSCQRRVRRLLSGLSD
jgi:hypothetical protein